MAGQDAYSHQRKGKQVDKMNGLQGDEYIDAESQQDQEAQVYARTYPVFMALDETMDGAYHEHDEGVSQYGEFPQGECTEINGIKGGQFNKGLIKRFHVVVVIRISEQEPVGETPTEQCGKEAADVERLKVGGANQQHRNQEGDLRKDQTAQSHKNKGMEEVSRRPGALIGTKQQVEGNDKQQRGYIARTEILYGWTGGNE